MSVQVQSQLEVAPAPPTRRSANWRPTLLDDASIQSLKSDIKGETCTSRIEKLKADVRCLLDEAMEPAAKLELIDVLQRLGVAYHFEKEIEGILAKMSKMNSSLLLHDDLCSTALHFRLLREHGYKVSEDVFKCFQDEMGRFKACLCHDTIGMLSLYEASYLAIEGESILEEARAFTVKHLRDLEKDMDQNLKEKVTHALELPLNWRMLRAEAWWFINNYGKDVNRNPLLFELAKLDYNMVQGKYKEELKEISRWWIDLGFCEKLTFARDRVIESFFIAVGISFEPQYSYCREILTKIICLATTVDDVYDIYGSVDELELFTDVVERWDINAMEQLPEYMKICFLAVFNTVNEMTFKILKDKGLDTTVYLKRVWAELCKAYLVEAKWYHSKHKPTFEEYMDNASMSIGTTFVNVYGFFCVSEDITKEALEILMSYPDLMSCSNFICRLINDMGTSLAELERGDVPKSIQCYMNEKNVSEATAREHSKGLISEIWKKVEQDRLRLVTSPLPKPYIDTVMNLARSTHCLYLNGSDGYGAPGEDNKNRIASLLIEPISLI